MMDAPLVALAVESGLLALLGVGLFAMGPANRPARAFALVMVLQGIALFCAAFAAFNPDLAAARYWGRLHPYFLMAAPLAAMYFLSTFPVRPRWLPAGPWLALGFAAAGAALSAAYIVRPALFWDLSTFQGGDPYDEAGVTRGWLVLLSWALELVAAIASLGLARSYVRSRRGPRRTTTLMTSLGFIFAAACTCALYLLIFRIRSGILFNPPADAVGQERLIRLADDVLVTLQVAMVLVILAYCLAAARRSRDARVRLTLQRYPLVLAATLAPALVILFLVPSERTQGEAVYMMWGFWSLVSGIVIAYGILRHRLFDLDLKLKAGAVHTLAIATIPVAFLLINELVEKLLPFNGLLPGLAAAMVVALAFRPIERLAARLLDRAFPHVRASQAYLDARKSEVYRGALEELLRDGLQPRESAFLADLRRRLGVSEQAHESMLREMRLAGG